MARPNPQNILSSFGFNTRVTVAATGRNLYDGKGASHTVISPLDDAELVTFKLVDAAQREQVVATAVEGFKQWRTTPAPTRVEVLKTLRNELHRRQDDLAALMQLEMGKPLREAKGEIADAITTADYSIGLARQIGGINRPSARKDVELHEKWHPLGAILVITAFNFPMSLWAWNAFPAIACGNSVIWKPAPQTPLFSAAITDLIADVLAQHPEVPEGVFSLIQGDNETASIPLVTDKRLPLVSATGSTAMGRAVGKVVTERLGRVILELGGNAGAIFTPSADMESSLRQAFFAATFNGGQRCTALRRLLVHESRYDEVVKRLKTAYTSWQPNNIYGTDHGQCPLVDSVAAKRFHEKLAELKTTKGVTLWNAGLTLPEKGCFVPATLALLDKDAPQPAEETFGPLLYVQPYSTFEEALAKHNAVSQGLGSGIYSQNLAEIQLFTSTLGSDAGMAAVNDNTGGLEVALAFGGHKDSGLGSEKGSDSWKQYMRRQSVVLNHSTTPLPDAGIDFGK